MRPILFIIFDGLGDRLIPQLGNKTPLEAAAKPNLDRLAEIGITGLIHTIKRGIRPGSDVAHLSLLGYDPKHNYMGRGPFEAAGYGLDLEAGDIALRGNLGTVNSENIVIDRRAGRIDSSAPFAKLLNGLVIDGVTVITQAGLNHRIAIALRGERLSPHISDVDPHLADHPLLLAAPLDASKEAAFTASVVNKLVAKAHSLFESHSLNKERRSKNLPVANVLLLRGAGEMKDIKPFHEVYTLKAACVAGGGLYKGIARVLGMDVYEVSGATGKANTDAVGKVNKALELLQKYDFVFLHFKATDSLAEDGKPLEKRDYIEKVDKALAPLVPLAQKREMIVSVTGDHTTASDLKVHTADEVPILISGYGVRTDYVNSFGERPCQEGGLGHMEGRNLIDYLLNLRGELALYGN